MTLLFESFVFGAVNSLHCACMCGPLALAFQGGTRGALAYHITRTTSYTSIGVVLGGLGSVLGSQQLGTPTAYVAFVLAAGLIVLAPVGERGALSIPGLGSALQNAMARTRQWSATKRAGLLGLFTPLLPCGLLWAALAGATVAVTLTVVVAAQMAHNSGRLGTPHAQTLRFQTHPHTAQGRGFLTQNHHT